MINELAKDAEQRMHRSVEALRTDLIKIRTGRASVGILEHLSVDYYGNETPLNQVANIMVENARTLMVSPWEDAMIAVVEKAIRNSDLGLNPATAGKNIRVPLPALTEERRKDMIKVIRDEGEKARVAIRNIRRDCNSSIKDLLKEKEISEDDEHRAQGDIQKLTDKMIAEVDKAIEKKETDIMTV